MVITAPTVKLANGEQIPLIGLGTYARKADPLQYKEAVEYAVEAGYRHIDTASSYKNEEEVGEGIYNKIKQGLVTREELFVTTKAKGEDSKIDYLETWRGMEQAVNLGYAKSIGVSNFNEDQLKRLLQHSTVKPVVNQFEISPTLTQHALTAACLRRGVLPVAYTPLGLLSDARPEFATLGAIKSAPELKEIADSYGKSKPQIVLRYLVQRGIPVLPKSFTKSRIEENFNIFDFELSDADMKTMDSFNINHRCVPATSFKHLENYPF